MDLNEEEVPGMLDQVKQNAIAKAAGEELPMGEPQREAAAPEEVIEEVIEEAPAVEAKVIVGGREYASEQEAYADVERRLREVEQENLLMAARQEGLQEGMQYGVPKEEEATAPPDNFDEEFYSDPQGYLSKREEKIRQDIQMRLQNEQIEKQLWNDFFSEYPDLDGFKDIVEMKVAENKATIQALAKKDRSDAFKFIAMKSRELFQNYSAKLKPTEELTNKNVVHTPPGSGSPVSVTPEDNSDEGLDMASQISNMRRARL
jgi:hypothetical protein